VGHGNGIIDSMQLLHYSTYRLRGVATIFCATTQVIAKNIGLFTLAVLVFTSRFSTRTKEKFLKILLTFQFVVTLAKKPTNPNLSLQFPT